LKPFGRCTTAQVCVHTLQVTRISAQRKTERGTKTNGQRSGTGNNAALHRNSTQQRVAANSDTLPWMARKLLRFRLVRGNYGVCFQEKRFLPLVRHSFGVERGSDAVFQHGSDVWHGNATQADGPGVLLCWHRFQLSCARHQQVVRVQSDRNASCGTETRGDDAFTPTPTHTPPTYQRATA
jgi:hypothetical protein